MIDSVMNTLFPVVSGETSITETSTRENPNSNGSDFGQVLSLLMAQMGLTAIPFQQDSNNSVMEAEVHSEAQPENISPIMANPIDTELPSNVTGGIAEEIIQLPASDIECNSTVEQKNEQAKDLTLVKPEVKQDITATPETQDDLLLQIGKEAKLDVYSKPEIQENLLLQIGTDLGQKIAEVPLELTSIEPTDVIIKNSAQLNSSQKENLSADSQKIIIPADLAQISEVMTASLSQIQDKLHIKNMEISTLVNPEEQQKLGLLKLGQISNDKNIQSGAVETQTNTQQKYMDIWADIKHYLSDNANGNHQDNLLSKVLETRLISNSGEQNNSNSQHKSDLPNSNPQLGILSEKSLKIGNEGVSDKTLSIAPSEPKEVVANLSSLRSVLAEQIKFAVRSETKTITIRLEPESLGLMEVKVQEHSGNIGIQLTTSNNDVHKVLSQGLPQLREVLKQEGIFVKDVQVVSTGTASLMLNQDFNSHSFSREVQIEPTSYHINRDSQQTVEETKPISDYHNGTLSLWV